METHSKVARRLAVAVKKFRDAKNLTQAEFALRAGVRRITIIRIEKRKWSFDFNTLDGVARALGTTGVELIRNVEAGGRQ